MKQLFGMLLVLLAISIIAYLMGVRLSFQESESPTSSEPRLEFLVGGTTPYWQSVIIGARKAAEDHDAQLTVRVPERDGKDQTRHLVMIDTDKVDGVAISPLFPDEQTRVLSALASEINVVTYGNDVPRSLRQYYIGTDNHNAGRLAAELVRQALPDGGKVALFIGDGNRDVARTRLHSFYHSLLATGQTIATLDEPIPAAGTSEKYEILE
ncbi:MAG: substrate-binding domain-containing protein, partial [Bythopirellula sp.]